MRDPKAIVVKTIDPQKLKQSAQTPSKVGAPLKASVIKEESKVEEMEQQSYSDCTPDIVVVESKIVTLEELRAIWNGP